MTFIILFTLVSSIFCFRLISAIYCAFIKGELYGYKHSIITKIMEEPLLETLSLFEYVHLYLTGKNFFGIILEYLISLSIAIMIALFVVSVPWYISVLLVSIFVIVLCGFEYRRRVVKRMTFVDSLRGDDPPPLFKKIN